MNSVLNRASRNFLWQHKLKLDGIFIPSETFNIGKMLALAQNVKDGVETPSRAKTLKISYAHGSTSSPRTYFIDNTITVSAELVEALYF